MSIERLTKYGKTSHENGVCCTHFNSKECNEVAGNCALNCKWEEAAWSKLAAYEDAEEQGLLVRLPCNVGDVLWWADAFGDIRNSKVNSMFIEQGIDGVVIETMIANVNSKDIGKTVFLTREEAEAALTEMEERR